MTDSADFDPAFFELRRDGDVAIVSLHDTRLTEEDNLEQFGQELFWLVDHLNCRKVLLRLQPLRYVTRAVLGKLITLHRKLGRNEGQLVLCELHDDLRDVLQTSRLLTYFTTADDVQSGLAALQ